MITEKMDTKSEPTQMSRTAANTTVVLVRAINSLPPNSKLAQLADAARKEHREGKTKRIR